MCGIAGLIHKKNDSNIGDEMTKMLTALCHRGPDSTGFALYGNENKNHIIRFKVAEQEAAKTGFHIKKEMVERKEEVDHRLKELGVKILKEEMSTEYAFRYEVDAKDLKKLVDYIEDIEGVEVLSIGNNLELIKDLGVAQTVSDQYSLGDFVGTHAIGHSRMATESDVDIRSAHPYWAYPLRDVSVVHNGQLTNYWFWRRELERKGHRFMSDCDSELIAVYLAEKINQGSDLQKGMEDSLDELDGVFTYLVATSDQLGMAKDVMAAKPMVLYESEDMVALASEEIAIRSILPQEIDTHDPYEGVVRVWGLK